MCSLPIECVLLLACDEQAGIPEARILGRSCLLHPLSLSCVCLPPCDLAQGGERERERKRERE